MKTNKTQAIREIMQQSAYPLSLMEIQNAMLQRYGLTCTDGTISRRLREMGADYETQKGINRYFLQNKEAAS